MQSPRPRTRRRHPPRPTSGRRSPIHQRRHLIDLHVHTTASDGRLSPGEVVAAAAERGLSALAITDHDVLSGLDEAVAAAPANLEVVPGIEMTASWHGSQRAVHVLGYFIDRNSPELQVALQRAQRLMERHVDAVLDEIRKVGGVLQRQDLDRYRHRYAGGAALVLGMLEHGVLRGAPPGTGMRLLRLAAAEPRAYSVGEAVGLIHHAGGVASLAHPAKLKRGEPLLSAEDLAPLMAHGFDAVEAWQWIPGGWGSGHYLGVADALGVLVSGGSDDHGKRTTEGAIRLGAQPVPSAVLEALRERALALRGG
ncbi:MAG: PHP domain-containing protein [Chloroflexi bacterium]|nr:MAG: PHP domain-containing protein [Chloroflexota bacterium]